MDSNTKGAWIVHHGRKLSRTTAAAEYAAIDIAAKSAALLARMAASDVSQIPPEKVKAFGLAGGLSPKTELVACLEQLKTEKVIDIGTSGTVEVLGVNARTALVHAAALYERNEPQIFEEAAIALGEIASQQPIAKKVASEYLSDNFKLSRRDTTDFMNHAPDLGFVDTDGDDDNPLLFNGNLFRRDNVAKTKKVLDSLTTSEQTAFAEFEDKLKNSGAVFISEALQILGPKLLSKLRAAAIFDENIVSNEAGDHSFITSPGAFHKFSDPLQDDAFDHAKALVAALSYGMVRSDPARGRIWGVDLILRKLLQGRTVGPVDAIGQDYRALEIERVVEIKREGRGFTMRLLKIEVGEIALQVLKSGAATASVIDRIPGAQVSGYVGPEAARASFRGKKDVQPSSRQMRSLLSSVRGGGGL